MQKITARGNLPPHLRVLAETFAHGKSSSEFYECSNAKELENLAKDKKCELTCTLDPKTERGFLLGFDVSASPIATVSGTSYHTMTIYFTEIKGSDYKRYKKMLDKHRTAQEDAMIDRREKASSRRNPNRFQPQTGDVPTGGRND